MMVFRLDVVSILKTRRSMEFLTEHGIEDGRLSLVGNRVGQAGELTKKTAERAVGRKIAHSLPDDPKIVNGAINVGSPALLEAPAAKVSKAIQLICDDLAASARGGGAGETSAIPETPIVLPRVVKRVADRLMTAVTDFEQQEESNA
jgi:Flp pilus assembly CpaE family ATPase